jgi:hypothetical protein
VAEERRRSGLGILCVALVHEDAVERPRHEDAKRKLSIGKLIQTITMETIRLACIFSFSETMGDHSVQYADNQERSRARN